ncbi:hypothetical protein [Streptomyces sp. NPDC059761]|uniref:hypothetical protein n=1 Tax=Streptomyces sp. NPDC059761 TaxID=3346937 RepID=UPI003669F410
MSERQFTQLEAEPARVSDAHGWEEQRWTLARIKTEIGRRFHLRWQPVDDVLERVEQALHVRLDRQALLRKRRSLDDRSERGTWVRIERWGFERTGPQGWNGTEAAAVLQGGAMPEWYQGVAWREQGEPVMWRADEPRWRKSR